jgi:hypothetical protein
MSINATALISRVRESARVRLAVELAAALKALPDELTGLAAASTSAPEQRLLMDAGTAAQAHAGAIAASFERSLVEVFDRKLRPAPPAPEAGEANFAGFTLVDDTAIELEIAFGRLVRKTSDELDADQLAGIAARLGELAVGKPLEGAANPLGPETALEALQAACGAAPEEGPVRMTLVNGLQPHVALALRKLYPEVNDMLIAQGVLPRIRREVQRARQGPAGVRGGPGGAGAGGAAGPGIPGAPGHGVPMPPGALPGLPAGITISQAMALKDLLPGATGSPIDVGAIVGALLDGPPATRRHGARMLANPDASLFSRAMATPPPAELLARLSELQSVGGAGAAAGPGDLAAVVDDLARTRDHPLDQLTGELVAVVFDFVLHDRDVPDAVKAEIARLQIVAFKAALLDRSFFARREHPLRELLSAVTDAGADPQLDGGPESRFVTGLRAIVDEVLAGFSDDLAVFDAARERLAAHVAELDEEAAKAVEDLASDLAETERGEEIRARAAAEVARRTPQGAPAFVERFLADTWTRALADAERHGGTGDAGWDARLALVDDLVWSVEPKQAADVPRLMAMLPKLVPALNRGMKAVDVPADAQRAFLDELMQAHTELLQAARSKRPPPPPPARPAAPAPSAPPTAPETLAAPELAADSTLGLERGAVVEFTDVEPPVRAKLAWISPKRTVYLFTARGAKARHISPSELAGALREGRARRFADGGTVIDRALAAAVGEEE